ncbi:hypothetical protein NX059_007034 [Plenodomus lindquistii]|nr:hypothetical protein NX059_007034 [Plenodomus lindquistii]
MAYRRTKKQLARQRHSTAGSVDAQSQQRTVPQEARGKAQNVNVQNRAPLTDRMTRDEIHCKSQPGREKQAAPGQASSAKRKRGETDDSAQEQKRLRVNTNASCVSGSQIARGDSTVQNSAVEKTVLPAATDLRTLQNMNDEQKKSRRLDRFASNFTKKNGGSLHLSPRNLHREHEAAKNERAVASPDIITSTQGSKSADGDSIIATTGGKCAKKHIRGSRSAFKEPLERTMDNKADSVSQSSLAPIVRNQQVGDHVSREKSPQDSPCCGEKGNAQDQIADALTDPDRNTQSSSKQQEARTNDSHVRCTNAQLQTLQVIIDDDRQPIVEPNPECLLDYKPYDHSSVLLLASVNIIHDETAEESVSRFFRSNQIFNQEAMDMYKRPWTPEDLGRGSVNKMLPTHMIDDCDLYLHLDKKVYVATPIGLLLAADYCKIIGIPDEQAVRFKGRKPKWAKILEVNRHWRRVETACPYDSDAILQPCLALKAGSIVEVLERCSDVDSKGIACDFAYGRRAEDGTRGYFDYKNTCRMDWAKDHTSEADTPDPEIIDWTKYDYVPGARNARRYLAGLAIDKYPPPLQRQTIAVRKETTASSGALQALVSSTTFAGKGVVPPRASATMTATASTAVSDLVSTTSPSSDSSEKKLQVPMGTSIFPAVDNTTTAVAVTSVKTDQDVQRADVLSVAGGSVDGISQDESEPVDEYSDDITQTSSRAFDTDKDLGLLRHDSHEPKTNTNDEDNEAKLCTKDTKADRNFTSDVIVTSSIPVPPTAADDAIRRRVGSLEYVEDEVDYDDDEL